MTQPTIAQLHNLTDRAAHGLTPGEQQRLRDGIDQLASATDSELRRQLADTIRALGRAETELAGVRAARDRIAHASNSGPGTEPAQPAAAYQQLLARLETEHAKSVHNATHASRPETRLSVDGIAAGLDIAIAHAITVFEGHEARQAWTTRQQQAASTRELAIPEQPGPG